MADQLITASGFHVLGWSDLWAIAGIGLVSGAARLAGAAAR
jgi:hypothetical protein